MSDIEQRLREAMDGVTPGPWVAEQSMSRKYLDAVLFQYQSGIKGTVALIGKEAAQVATPPAERVVALPDNVKTVDIEKMVAALSNYRGDKWWFKTENEGGDPSCLSPMTLQNMKLGYEAGTLEPSMGQITNLLKTAIHYQRKFFALAAKPAVKDDERVVALLDERQKRAEQVYDRILAARDGIRVNLSPDSPEWLRDAFNKLHEAHHIMGGDPFDMHMRAALAAKEGRS